MSQQTSQTFTSGSSFTLPSPGTRGEHYTFGYWLINTQQGELHLQPGQSITVLNTDLTIEPVWIGKTYTVSFNLDGSTSPSYIAPMQKQYPGSIILPSVTKSNYYLSGWDDGTTVHIPGSSYKPTSDIALNPVFVANQYTVRFYDVGQSTPLSTQTITYPANATVPTTPTIPSGITYIGWKKKGTTSSLSNIIIHSEDATYQPTSDIDLERVYNYTVRCNVVRLDGTDYYYRGSTRTYPNTSTLPTSDETPSYVGYEMKGWGSTKNTPNPSSAYSGSYTFTPSYTVVDNVVVLQAIPTLYSQYTPKELSSLSFGSQIISITVGQPITVSVTSNPNDYLGTITWSANPTVYFDIEPNTPRSVVLNGKLSTDSAQVELKAEAPKKSWQPTGEKIEATLIVKVYAYNIIKFKTRDADGKEIDYLDNEVDGKLTNEFYVNTNTGEWEDVGSKTYPDDPPRVGFTFLGWVDGDGNMVDENHPPQIPTTCYATWTYQYVPQDKDSAYLQLFNFDTDRLIKQLDLGAIQSNTESFSTGVSATPTPTMSSVNTFITNLSCSESISVNIIRISPVYYNDDSDDSLHWSNRKWITEMRALVDRWQASTDGIKFLYIPKNLRISEVVGQLAGYGDNYDLLGYVKEYDAEHPTNNLGLLFEQGNETYVL